MRARSLFGALTAAVAVSAVLIVPVNSVYAADELTIDETNFPGVVSIARQYDADKNGKLSASEIASCTSIVNYNAGTKDYSGINRFTSLKTLDISVGASGVTSYDFSNLTKLETLKLYGFESVTITGCTNLKELKLTSFKGTALNTSKNTNLQILTIENGNTNIVELDLTKNTALKEMKLDTKQLNADLSKLVNLEKLDLFNTQVYTNQSFFGLPNLTWLNFDAGNEYVDDLSKCTKLEYLRIESGRFKTDMSAFSNMKDLYMSGCVLKDKYMNLSAMKDLEKLKYSGMSVSNIDLSKNTKLKSFDAWGMYTKSIDVSGCSEMTYFRLASNDLILPSLDLSKNTKLESVYYEGNGGTIDSLDLSASAPLTYVRIENVKNVVIGDKENLESLSVNEKCENLDLGVAPKLKKLNVSKNDLTEIDITGCRLILNSYQTVTPTVSDGITKYGDAFVHDTATSVLADVLIDGSYFPDANFRAYLSEVVDKDQNGRLTKTEINNVKSINCSNRTIADLTGIDFFTNLTTLNCSKNSLTALDLSAFKKLKTVNCSYNSLSESGPVFHNDAPMNDLNCSHNAITVVTKFPVTLTKLDVSYNSVSGEARFSRYGSLVSLKCMKNQITSVTVDSDLTYLDASNNVINSFTFWDRTGTIETFYCYNNKMTYLNLRGFSSLKEFKGYGNKNCSYNLSPLWSDVADVMEEQKVGSLDCLVFDGKYYIDKSSKYTPLIRINSNNFPDPAFLAYLKELDTDKNGSLFYTESKIYDIDCSNRGIKDLSGLELLGASTLDCSFNDISSINMNELGLYQITCYGNPDIKEVVVSDYKLSQSKPTKTEKTEKISVGGKEVTVTYDMYEWNGGSYVKVDKGVKLVSDNSVEIQVKMDKGIGTVKGAGTYVVGDRATLDFDPADGIKFVAWLDETGTVISGNDYMYFVVEGPRTLTVSYKLEQKVYFDKEKIEMPQQAAPFINKLNGAKTEVTYASFDTKVATVDPSTGAVTVVAPGTTYILARGAESDKYVEFGAMYEIVVTDAIATATPTPLPSPTATATPKPTATPTKAPTAAPSVTPAAKPTTAPTSAVTTPVPTSGKKPTVAPSGAPTSTVEPTVAPSGEPTPTPTTEPSTDPKAQILAFVERIYVYVLDREPEAEGAAYWSDELYSFRRTGAEVAQGFIFSPEFEGRGTTDTEFVTILYKTFFGRDPEEGGMNYWLSQLSTGTMDRVTVANGFIYSQEWADTCASYGIRSGGDLKPTGNIAPTDLTYAFVERMYTTAMGRGYDEEGKQYWAGELANFNVTGEQVGASFFLSAEMEGYNLSDKDFLGRLYATFMDRESDADGEAYWLGVMESGAARADVVYGFTRSPEFTDKCVEARILPY